MLCATCKNSDRCKQAQYVDVLSCPSFTDETEEATTPAQNMDFRPRLPAPRDGQCHRCWGVFKKGDKVVLNQMMSGVCYEHDTCPENPEKPEDEA